MQLVDTHVHINFDVFEDDLDAIAQAWRAAGVVHVVHSCVEPGEIPSIQLIADRYPGEVSFAVGLHPLDVDLWQHDTAEHIANIAVSDQRIVAIGEIGLDFYKATNREIQQHVFQEQLKLAHKFDLPVIIHCRDAAADMAGLLRDFWQVHGPVRGVMHCWSGTPEETEWFLDLGFYVSFSGIVTFKNADQVKASAAIVPDHRILVETDCPFLTPVPKRKERRNQPAYVRHIAEHLAQLRGVPLSELARQTTQNAIQLFKLPIPIDSPCGVA